MKRGDGTNAKRARGEKLLLVGATSAICEQVARLLSSQHNSIYLAGRNSARLKAIRQDLEARGGGEVAIETLDLALTGGQPLLRQSSRRAFQGDFIGQVVDRARRRLGGLDTVILAQGLLPDQEQAEKEAELLYRTFEVNSLSVMAIATRAAALFRAQGQGQIVVIGSVAGDRGRASNFCYGAAKGALEIFVSGLRQQLHGRGVDILLIKPGFVDTPMTANFEKKGLLWTTPQRAASDIVAAMKKKRSKRGYTIYTPWFWSGIMLIVRLIPERLFLRLKF